MCPFIHATNFPDFYHMEALTMYLESLIKILKHPKFSLDCPNGEQPLISQQTLLPHVEAESCQKRITTSDIYF